MVAFVEEQSLEGLRSFERGRTQFILGELWIGAISEDSGRRIEQGASPCLLETFDREGGHILEGSIQHQRGPWEDSVDPQGRHFRVRPFQKRSLGFFGYCE